LQPFKSLALAQSKGKFFRRIKNGWEQKAKKEKDKEDLRAATAG
jgi:hypothetical protein